MNVNTTTFHEITPATHNSFCGPAKCPHELLGLIFSYLSSLDLVNASHVCREFKNISHSLPKFLLLKFYNATALVLGTDMRGKTKVDFKQEKSSFGLNIYPTFDYKISSIKPFYPYTYLFIENKEIVWYVSRAWDKKLLYRELIYDHVFHVGNLSSHKTEKFSSSSLFTKITKTKDDRLICIDDRKFGSIKIFKSPTNKFASQIEKFSFKKDINCIKRITSEITPDGLLAIGESLPDCLQISIYNFIRQTKIKIQIENLKEITFSGLALFPFKDDLRLAIVYAKKKYDFLYIYSCKDKKELFQIDLSKTYLNAEMQIKEEKIVISDSFVQYTQVVDLENKKIIFSREGCYPTLHQNNLILINARNKKIEIYPLSSQQPMKPIIIPIELMLRDKQYAVSDDRIASIDGQDIKLFDLNTGKHITTFSTAKIDNPGIPSSIYFEMKDSDSYLCVILEDTRVIYYSPKDFTKPIDAPTLSDQHI